MAKVGCQPPFSRFEVKGLRLCDNWTLLKRYNEEFVRFYPDTRSNIIGSSKCLMPCSFMEYKVSMQHLRLPVLKLILNIQMTETPTPVPVTQTSNMTTIIPFFTSESVLVSYEEEAHSLGSLVADIGGVLGLFVGFNFVMVWDWIVSGIRSFGQKICRCFYVDNTVL